MARKGEHDKYFNSYQFSGRTQLSEALKPRSEAHDRLVRMLWTARDRSRAIIRTVNVHDPASERFIEISRNLQSYNC